MTSEERKDFEAATKEQYDILNAIKDAYETATKDLLTSNFTESKQWIEWFSKQGYRAVLASAPRAVAEITTNGQRDMCIGDPYIISGINTCPAMLRYPGFHPCMCCAFSTHAIFIRANISAYITGWDLQGA